MFYMEVRGGKPVAALKADDIVVITFGQIQTELVTCPGCTSCLEAAEIGSSPVTPAKQ